MAVKSEKEIIGTIGKVYELRTVGSDNRSVIEFSVAVTPRKKQGDDWIDEPTVWTNVVAWGRLADNIHKSFKSGDRVFVKGYEKMKEEYTYNDRETGEEKTAQAKVQLIAEFAGHELSYAPSTQHRENKNNNDSNSNSRPAAKTAPAKKAAPAKKQAAPSNDDLDLDLNLDDDDIDFDSEDLPF